MEEEGAKRVGLAGEAAAAAAATDPEARYKYDEDLLIKGKGKSVVQPKPPSEAEKRILTQKLQEEIDKRSERIKVIKQGQELARSSRTAPGANQPYQRLQILKQQFNTVLVSVYVCF